MTTLLANQGFDTAIIALVVALTAYVQQRVSQAKQGRYSSTGTAWFSM